MNSRIHNQAKYNLIERINEYYLDQYIETVFIIILLAIRSSAHYIAINYINRRQDTYHDLAEHHAFSFKGAGRSIKL